MTDTPRDTRVLWIMRDDGDMTEPMNIMLLSALGKQNRHWRSSHLALLERDDIVTAVRDLKPQIVAASAITGSHKFYLEALRALKQEFGDSIFTMLGGPYCSTYPEVIAERQYLDAVGVLECDDAWPEFLDAFERDRNGIHNIPNVLTRENHTRVLKQRPIGNGKFSYYVDPQFYRNRRSNFDELPYMDRSLVYENTAFKHRLKRTHMAGRGCPFRCTYCFEHDWNEMYRGKGKMLQRYSPVRFCEELKDVMGRYDTRFWKLYDDVFPTFPTDLDWLREFAEVYPKMVGLPFHCLTRCDLVAKTPEVLSLLKQAGIASLTMSIESGNRFIRDHIVRRDMTEREIRFAFGLADKLGIYTFANTILGIPGPLIPHTEDPKFDERVAEIVEDTKRTSGGTCQGKPADLLGGVVTPAKAAFVDDSEGRKRFVADFLKRMSLHHAQLEYDRESIRFNNEVGVSFGEFAILHPYPRTAASEWLIYKGFFDGNFDKLHASYQNRSPLNCFTEQEKSVQQNLALLGTVSILFSGSRNTLMRLLRKPVSKICVDWLSRITSPWATFVYEQFYAFAKSRMHETRMYPFRRTWKEKALFYLEMWQLDWWKQFGHKSKLRGSRPGQTLGGPPSV